MYVEFGVVSPWFQCNVLRFMGQFIGMFVRHTESVSVCMHCVAMLPLHRGLKCFPWDLFADICFFFLLLRYAVFIHELVCKAFDQFARGTQKHIPNNRFNSAIEQIFRALCNPKKGEKKKAKRYEWIDTKSKCTKHNQTNEIHLKQERAR